MASQRPSPSSDLPVPNFASSISLGLFFALLCGALMGAAGPARAELPPHGDNHPRLFYDAASAPDLYAAIQADPQRQAVWLETLATVDSLTGLLPEEILDEYFGYQFMQELSLVARLEPSAAATRAEETLERVLYHQVAHYDAETNPFLGVLAPALRLQNLAWGFDNGFSQASELQRQYIVSEILLYLETILAEPEFSRFLYNPFVSNKGVVIGSSLLLAVLVLEEDVPDEPLLAEAESLGWALLDKALGDLFGDDGSYREGLAYLSWSLRNLVPAWQAMDNTRGIRAWDDEQVMRILECLAYQMLPEGEGKLLNRNNHNTSDYLFSRHHSFLEWSTANASNPDLARWILRRISGDLGHSHGHESDPVATLLWHRAGAEWGPHGLAFDRYFPDRGLYINRGGWPGDPLASSYLLSFEAGKFMGGHAQEDVGQFSFRAMGHGFALDNGAGATAKETAAHNLVLVDGLGQHNAGSSIGTDGKLEVLLKVDFGIAIRADLRQAYSTHSEFNDPDWPWDGMDWSWGYDGGNPMRMALRDVMIFYSDDGAMPGILLRDFLIKAETGAHSGNWRMHMDRDLDISAEEGPVWLAQGANGALHMTLHMPPAEETIFSVTEFDNDNGDPDTQVFQLMQSNEILEYFWQFTPLLAGAEAPVTHTERYAAGTVIFSQHEGRERKILATNPGDVLLAGKDLLDGAYGFIERQGATTRTFLVRGHQLVENGRLLVELEQRGSAAYTGDTVVLSTPGGGFRVWAPDADRVEVNGRALAFVRDGDYVADEQAQGILVDAGDPWAEGGGLRLAAPFPNPGSAPLRFAAAADRAGVASLEIFDVRGRLVRRLFAGRLDGERQFLWDGRGEAGAPAGSGVYFARLSRGAEVRSRKFLLLRP